MKVYLPLQEEWRQTEMMQIKKSIGLFMAVMVLISVMFTSTVPAYAYGNDPDPVTEATPTPKPKKDKDENKDKADESKLNNSDGAFTETGNLTLTDDVTDTEEENMQFLTVTSRNGHTYYIVIDRNRNSQNVYFLNQVDERDLLNLLSDEERTEYNGNDKPDSNPIVDLFGGETTPEPTEKPAKEDKKESGNNASMFIILFTVFGGAGFFFYKLKIEPEKSKDNYRDSFEDDEDEYIDEEEIN